MTATRYLTVRLAVTCPEDASDEAIQSVVRWRLQHNMIEAPYVSPLATGGDVEWVPGAVELPTIDKLEVLS